jgi:transposase-like protein
LPEKITIDQSGSNTAAIKCDNQTHKTAIVIRHSNYLNNIVEIVSSHMTNAAYCASRAVVISTNPNPCDLPVNFSVITCTEATAST